MAVALARGTRVSIAVIGRVSLHDLTFADVGAGAGKDSGQVTVEEALAEVARTARGTIRVRAPLQSGETGDVEFTSESEGGEAIAWLTSERCLLGIWRRSMQKTPFVALVAESAPKAFTRAHREMARMALIYETERLAWLRNTDGISLDTALTRALMRHLAVGLMVVDAEGRVLQTNEIADLWLEAQDAVSVKGGRLTGDRSEVRGQIRTALRRAAAQEPRRPALVALPSEETGCPSSLMTFVPLGDATARALVICGRRSADASLGEMVLDALGLTRSERRLARSLVLGLSIEDAAREANVTTSTARSYVKRIFAKTGVRRQSEFVALLAHITPPVLLECLGRTEVISRTATERL